MPADIEGGKLREEAQGAVGQVVVDPPSHFGPLTTVGNVINKPWNDDAGCRPVSTACIGVVPNVAGEI